MTRVEERNIIVGSLANAVRAFTAGEIGERELIAVALAANDMLDQMPLDEQTQALYRPMYAKANHALLDRAAELK